MYVNLWYYTILYNPFRRNDFKICFDIYPTQIKMRYKCAKDKVRYTSAVQTVANRPNNSRVYSSHLSTFLSGYY